MTDPIQFETLRNKIGASVHELCCAVYSTQNLQLPDDPAAYKASALAAGVNLQAALRALTRHLKT